MDENKVTETQENENENETKTYTQEEVLALIQSEADKRVAQALKTQQKKYEKQLSLSKLDGEAREQAEKDDKIAELEQKLAQMTIESNRSELKSTLGARGLDARFADLLTITDDAEANQKVIADFDKLWKAAVNAEVENRLKSNTPKISTTTSINEKSAKKMNLAEISKLKEENPELFDKFFG